MAYTYKKPETTLEHLEEWLRQHKTDCAVAPIVADRIREERWQEKAYAVVRQEQPLEIQQQVKTQMDANFQVWQKNLPLRERLTADPEELSMSAGSTAVGTSVSTYAVLTMVSTFESEPLVHEYESLQEELGRESQARTRLVTLFPKLADVFDDAHREVRLLRVGVGDAPSAANAMRNLVLRFRGEVEAKARKWEGENRPSWELVSERWTEGRDSTAFSTMLAQESIDRELREKLSDQAKAWTGKNEDLGQLWIKAVGYIYVVCGCARRDPA